MAFNLNNIPTAKSSEVKRNEIEKLLKKEIIFFGDKFSNKKKQSFYLELAILLKAGITLKEGLTLIIESFKKKSDKEMLTNILHQVVNGKPFSDALQLSNQFSEYEYYSIKIGEETGTIARVCRELGIFYDRKDEQKRIVIAALTYPCIVLGTAFLVVLFMLSYVVPMFEDIFKQNNIELPFLTQIIIKMSEFTKLYGMFIFLLVLASIFALRFLKNKHQYKKSLHYLVLKIPVFGSFINKVYLAQFTQAVALLTGSKVPILNSIQMVRKMIQFIPLQDALKKIENNILKGGSLSESMQENILFDNRIISLIKVAEETNQTEYVFNQLNEQYNQEVIQKSKIMATILEPFIIVFVGVLVAILLIAMYLPMFQLSSVIG